MKKSSMALGLLLSVAGFAYAEYPPAPKGMVDWPVPFTGDFPAIAADSLLDKPAAKNGPVVVRDGHFFTGNKRIRFWGVNFAFSANFPTHEMADAVAVRLAHLGINSVRLHHMDTEVYPNGIWADAKMETLSPEALDRLDYLIDALAKQGIYCNLNLHVSRSWVKTHNFPNYKALPDNGSDKLVDLFHPDIIAADKQYMRDLLNHVNAYTHHRYAEDPDIAIVEINNENTLFMWGAEQNLSKLPEPYAGLLNKLWNDWLAKKYPTRDALQRAWAKDESPFGQEMLKWTVENSDQPRDYSQIGKEWEVEEDGDAKATAIGVPMPNDAQGIKFAVTKIDGTGWHVQFHQPGLKIEKGKFYTVQFSVMAAKAAVPAPTVGISQAHAPWENLGLGAPFKADTRLQKYSFGFTANDNDDNARLAFVLGNAVNTFTFTDISVREGGRLGLQDTEDQTTPRTVASHKIGSSETPARTADWFDFLQQTDQAYFVSMREFLINELGVKAPITGTIGLGPLSSQSQSHMDFVDGHEYWNHPDFPHRPWDQKDWFVKDTAMVDEPDRATLWGLAGTRVAGKPFTVTEYSHPSPNDWAAESVPMIASYAALQDWDGIYLFAYSHDSHFDKDHTAGFFDIESTPSKLPFLPLAARIFLGHDVEGAIAPLPNAAPLSIPRQTMLDGATLYTHQMWKFLTAAMKVKQREMLNEQFAINFDAPDTAQPEPREAKDANIATWTAKGAGTGKYTVNDPHGIVFTGFPGGQPVDIGPLRIESMESPFASMILVPADPAQPIATADKLLLCIAARSENTGMVYNADRTSVTNQWGNGPTRIEVVKGTLSLPGTFKAFAINPDGTRGQAIDTKPVGDRTTITIGDQPTVWYEFDRQQ